MDGYVELIEPSYVAGATNKRYYFVNGINNSLSDARTSARQIANKINYPVLLIYSKADIPFVNILKAKDMNKKLRSLDFTYMMEDINALEESIIQDIKSGNKVTIFAHSRGAAVTYNSVMRLPLKGKGFRIDKQNLKVVTLGGFCPHAKEWNTSATVVSYVNTNDIVPDLWNIATSWTLYKQSDFSIERDHTFESYLSNVRRY